MEALNLDFPDNAHDLALMMGVAPSPPTQHAPVHPPHVSIFGASTSTSVNGVNGTMHGSEHDSDNDNNVKTSKAKGKARQTPVNIASEDAFPSLPTSATRTSVLSAWAQRPASVVSAKVPVKAASSAQLTYEILAHQIADEMVPRPHAPVELQKALSAVMARTKAQISFTAKPSMVVFLIKGKQEQCEIAKREIAASIAKKTTVTVTIPVSMCGVVVGAQGKNIKALQARTMTRITFPQQQQQQQTSTREKNSVSESKDKKGEFIEEETEPTVEIAISGDVSGVETAKREIDVIMGDKAGQMKGRIPTSRIAPSVYPLIRGVHDTRLKRLQSELGVDIAIPPVYSSVEEQESDINATEGSSKRPYGIIVTGKRDLVRTAMEHIEQAVEQMKRSTQALQIGVPRRQFRFLIGPKGANLTELLETTGCFVTLPESNDLAENVTVYGSQDALVKALQFVMAKANEVAVSDIDLTTLVAGKDHLSAQMLLKYFSTKKHRTAIQSIANDTDTQVLFPHISKESETDENEVIAIEIHGKTRPETDKARARIVDYINSHGLFHYVAVPIPVEMHRHPFIITTLEKLINQPPAQIPDGGRDVHAEPFYPTDGNDTEDLIVVLLTRSDKTGKKIGKAFVEVIKSELLKTCKEAVDFVSETVNVPTKYRHLFTDTQASKLQQIITECNTSNVKLTIRLLSAAERLAAQTTDTANTNGVKNADESQLLIKGERKEVKKACTMITATVEKAQRVEAISGFTTEFTIPARFSSHIVGKLGSGMQKLKETPGIVKVEIGSQNTAQQSTSQQPQRRAQLSNIKDKEKEPVVTISLQGTEKAIAEVKQTIQERVAQLADTITVTLNIPNQYHRKIIGQQGKYVKRLQDKYGVRIEFPRDAPGAGGATGEDDNDQDETPKNRQDPNSVIVKGNKKGVEAARAEIIELYDYEAHHGHRTVMIIPSTAVSLLIGKQGTRINQLKQFTNVRIDLPMRGTNEDVNGRTADDEVDIKLEGAQADIKKCKAIITRLLQHFSTFSSGGGSSNNWTSETISIPRQFHRRLIGPGGQAIRDLLTPFNTAPAAAQKNEGAAEKETDAAKSMKTAEADPEIEAMVRLLLGEEQQQGSNKDRNKDTDSARVFVQFPDARKQTENEDVVVIKGVNTEVVQAVRALLEEKINALSNATVLYVHLPRSHLPSIIGRGGSGIRELKSRHKVEINIQDNINKNETAANNVAFDESEGPLGSIAISGLEKNCRAAVDDLSRMNFTTILKVPSKERRTIMGPAASNLRHLRDRYNVNVDLPAQRIDGGEDCMVGEEVWIVRGEKQNVQDAVKYLEDIMHKSTSSKSLTRKIEDVESEYHRHIIGRGGQTIQQIRAGSNTQIEVPKGGSGNRTIIVTGATEEDLDEAERLIREAVERGRDQM